MILFLFKRRKQVKIFSPQPEKLLNHLIRNRLYDMDFSDLDNIQPMLLNNANNGIDWKNHTVKAEQVYARQNGTKKGSDTLYELADSIIQENIRKGNLEK